MHDKDDPTDCDDDSDHDDGRDIVCMTRMISNVYDDHSDFERDFCSIWRLLESILGPFWGHVGALGRLGGQDVTKWSIFQVRPNPFWRVLGAYSLTF